jgi:hypothetical protein
MFRNVFLSPFISMEDKFLLDWTTSAVYKFNDPGRPSHDQVPGSFFSKLKSSSRASQQWELINTDAQTFV